MPIDVKLGNHMWYTDYLIADYDKISTFQTYFND